MRSWKQFSFSISDQDSYDIYVNEAVDQQYK